MLTALTGTKSEAAAYEFTTLTCIPGVIQYNDAKIQLLDLPGIIEGAAEGKGRLLSCFAIVFMRECVLQTAKAIKNPRNWHRLFKIGIGFSKHIW